MVAGCIGFDIMAVRVGLLSYEVVRMKIMTALLTKNSCMKRRRCRCGEGEEELIEYGLSPLIFRVLPPMY